jgi:hypothetical protein
MTFGVSVTSETLPSPTKLGDCGGHIVIIVYSSYICNTPIVVEKILQLL